MSTPRNLATSNKRNSELSLILAVVLVGIFAFMQVYAIQSILPQLQQDLHASVVEIGNSVGITVLAVALLAPFVGILSDALGRKWLIVSSILFMAIPTALIAQVETVHGLLVLRFLQGLAVPGVSVVISAYIGEEFKGAKMIRIMTLYIGGSILGGFLGRFLIGHLTDFMHWRSAFLTISILNAIGGIIVLFDLPASRNFVANTNMRSSLLTLKQLLHNRVLLSACALGFCVLFVLVSAFTYVNFHLADEPFNYSPGQLANIFTVYLLGVAIMPLMGRIIPRFGARNTVLVSIALSMIGLLLTLVAHAWVIVLGLALAACGAFITQSANMSFIGHRIQSGRSLANGIYYSLYYSGGFFGTWICGLAYTAGAWLATVITLLFSLVCGWLIAMFLMPGLDRPIKP